MGEAKVTFENGKKAIIEYEGETPPNEQEVQSYLTEHPNVLKGGVETNVFKDVAKSARSGLAEIPRAAGKASNEYLRPLIGKEPLDEQRLEEEVLKPTGTQKYEPQTGAGNVAQFISSIAPYFAMFPGATVGNVLKSGATAGGVSALNEDNNPIIGAAGGALNSLATMGALKGLGKGFDWGALKLSAIPEHIQKAATTKGSKILDYLKFLEEGNPNIQLQELRGSIQKPFNLAQLVNESRLGKNVGQAKENLFNKYNELSDIFQNKALQENNLLTVNPDISKAKNLLNKTVSDRQYKGNPLEEKINSYIAEIEEGVSPERASELINQIDDLIKYNKDLASFNEFDKSFQKIASGLRQGLRKNLDELSPELQQANKEFSQGITQEEAAALKGIEPFSRNEQAQTARQSAMIQQAISNPNKQRLRELIKGLPLGEKTLKRAEEADLAKTLQDINLKGEGMPSGLVGLALRIISGIPRKISIENILPRQLQQAEGTYMPNAANQAIQKYLQLEAAKQSGYIDAQQYRDRR